MSTQHRSVIRVIDPKGGVHDVPESQAHGLVAQGFTMAAKSVSTTALRPTTGLHAGYVHFDTTLGKLITWIGGGGGMSRDAGVAESGFWTDGTGSAV